MTAYVPRDDLDVTRNLLDWNGDHPYTNYRTMFMELRALGYYIDLLTTTWLSVDASRYESAMLTCGSCHDLAE